MHAVITDEERFIVGVSTEMEDGGKIIVVDVSCLL